MTFNKAKLERMRKKAKTYTKEELLTFYYGNKKELERLVNTNMIIWEVLSEK